MKNRLPIIYEVYRFEGITQFLEALRIQKCRYYASDLLQADDDQLTIIENSVHRTMEIFKILHQQIESHFYKVYRGSPGYVFKDWKLSELACIYMLMNGDPQDLRNLAQQQTILIDQMLQHIQHPYQIVYQN
jgi:hypothetical protein